MILPTARVRRGTGASCYSTFTGGRDVSRKDARRGRSISREILGRRRSWSSRALTTSEPIEGRPSVERTSGVAETVTSSSKFSPYRAESPPARRARRAACRATSRSAGHHARAVSLPATRKRAVRGLFPRPEIVEPWGRSLTWKSDRRPREHDRPPPASVVEARRRAVATDGSRRDERAHRDDPA